MLKNPGLKQQRRLEDSRFRICMQELQEGLEAHAIVRSRARDCSYSSQEFVRYLSLQQLIPEPSILILHCSLLVPYFIGIIP